MQQCVLEEVIVAELNHTIVQCRKPMRSATFLAEMLGGPEPKRFGPFLVVEMENRVSLDFLATDEPIASQHYAFLISEPMLDVVLARVCAKGLSYWPDPGKSRLNEINHNDGGRGFYFDDPDGHLLEVLTRPYGSGTEAMSRVPTASRSPGR